MIDHQGPVYQPDQNDANFEIPLSLSMDLFQKNFAGLVQNNPDPLR